MNEAYVQAAGWKGCALGKTVDFLNGRDRKLMIVGVVRDYHYESLKEKIKPQLFSIDASLPFGKFVVRLKPAYSAQTLKSIEKIYHRLVPYHPFHYDFTEELNYSN